MLCACAERGGGSVFFTDVSAVKDKFTYGATTGGSEADSCVCEHRAERLRNG